MRKFLFTSFIMGIFLSISITVFAGSIPEDLLHYDGAEIFFAEVTDVYASEDGRSYVEVLPWKVIKGEVDLNPEQRTVYRNPNPVGDFKIKRGESYLFTYFDENNPTDIFAVTSYDTATLKLKNVTGDMWERFEKYLNEGRYTDAENERIDRLNSELPVEGDDVLFTDVIGVSEDDAENVIIYYYGTVYEIETKEFYNVANDIVLKDIKNVSLQKKDGDNFSIPNGMYIMVNSVGCAFVTPDCKVDKYGMHYSRLPVGEYTIKADDYAKLKKFIPENDAKSVIQTPIIGEMLRWAGLAVFVFVIAFVTGFAVKRKKTRS